MSTHVPIRRPRPSITRRDLVPDLGVAVGTVAVTVMVHWAILRWLGGRPPLFLFASMAAALTSWRGLGPGVLASSLGSTVGSLLFIHPLPAIGGGNDNVPGETLLMFVSSIFVCWLIYRLKAEQESVNATHDERNNALLFVAHELRSPLATVQLAAAMLERDRSGETSDRATKLILGSAARLGRVIDDLVDVTRVEAHGLRIDTAKVRLQDSILTAVEAAGPAIAQKMQCLKPDVAIDPPLWVNGDTGRLQQVFANLLSNASRYSPEGAEISISSRKDGHKAVIVVQDTGIGVRSEMLERIFEPFVRESGGAADGLGLGLTLVRSLVAQHGGHITAQSDGPGRGSLFVVELPLIPDDSRQLAETNIGGERKNLTVH